MTDFENILPLWRELETAGADYVLATVVAVEGPSYRKPGARMLLARDGRRAGTVSGGCLEAEVAKRAWWLTESGPTVERYSTVPDDGEMPYGSGCGGVVYILLERRATAAPLLTALESAFRARVPIAIATVLQGPDIGRREFAGLTVDQAHESMRNLAPGQTCSLHDLAEQACSRRQSLEREISMDGVNARIWVDYRAARPGLWIFGAGDDAKPILRLARGLGWFVAIFDSRVQLATRERFREADEVHVLTIADLPGAASGHLDLRPTDAAIVMTHSFEQDSRILAQLLAGPTDLPLAYLGVLGPQRRTRDILVEVARTLNHPHPEERAEIWLAQIHAPTGLDLGAETPATIALSIVAEIQQVLSAGTAQPLREVRAAKSEAVQG
jgi:xanthine/CO dehydrogenase XdhC/CoxF family maturation factor